MKRLKNLILFFLCFSMCFSLSSCFNRKENVQNYDKKEKNVLQKLFEIEGDYLIGIDWSSLESTSSEDIDLDASVFLCDSSDKVVKNENFVFYNNLKASGVEHTGDTLKDVNNYEIIKINLSAVETDVDTIVITVSLYKGEEKNQNFGMVENAYIYIVDGKSGIEVLRYNLSEDYSEDNTVIVAKIFRNNNDWEFNKVGSSFAGGLSALCENFGLNVD